MMESLDKKDNCDDKTCPKKDQNEGKPAINDISGKRDLKLREAEKMIANKDVIIKMLQQQVKKLEECYKNNMKETEDFRYKFCVANEQVKRLRACPRQREKRDKEKELKQIKGEMLRWKQQCDDLVATQDRCPCPFPSQCTLMNKMKNVEKFMKAHYELLQTLIERMCDRNDNIPSEQPLAIEGIKEDYNNKIIELQEEINRLKNENAKLQDQLVVPSVVGVEDTFIEVKDSLLETYKRTNSELQKKFSTLVEQLPPEVLEGVEEEEEEEEAELEEKRVSFSSTRRTTTGKESAISFHLRPQEIDGGNDEEDDLRAKLRKNMAAMKAMKENGDSIDKKSLSQDVEIQTPENVSIIEAPIKIHGEPKEAKKLETLMEEGNSLASKTPQIDVDEDDKKAKSRSISIMDEVGVITSVSDSDQSVNGSKSRSSNASSVAKKGSDSEAFQDTVCKCESTLDEEELKQLTERCNCSAVLVGPPRETPSEQGDSTTKENKFDNKNDVSEEIEENPLQTVFEEHSNKEFSVMVEVDNYNFNDMTEKLNEIRDQVMQLVEKQSNACKELEMLKNEMAESRETTQTCTQNIAKLQESLEDQRETFLNNFHEQKLVTDNLTEKNDKIQQELSELKNNIETLFQSVAELKSTTQSRPRKSDGSKATSDDLITMEECKYEIRTLKQDPVPITQRSVGVPTQYEDTLTQTDVEVEPETLPQTDVERKPQTDVEGKPQTDVERKPQTDVERKPQTDVIKSEDQEDHPQKPDVEKLEKLEEEYSDLKKENKAKDKKIKCINALISYYGNASKQVFSMYPRNSAQNLQKEIDDHLSNCKCGDNEIHDYIEKVKGENLKLKTTISSVIEHLNKKMSDLKKELPDEENSSDFCTCLKNHLPSDYSNDLDGYQSDISSTTTNSDDHSKNKINGDMEIEDIYNVVRRTFAPLTGRKFESSTSCCLCAVNKSARSSFPCCCSDCLHCGDEVNIEEVYRTVLRSTGNLDGKSSESVSWSCDPICPKSNVSKKSKSEDKEKSKDDCFQNTCGDTAKCGMPLESSSASLMSNLQTYVNYLHEQLAIITSIENRIEDMRVEVKSPEE